MSSQGQASPVPGWTPSSRPGVAVIGASDDITKIGGRPVQLLRKYGYAGAIYPINPKGGTLQGLPAYASILDSGPPHRTWPFSRCPQQATLQAVRDCASRGVRGVIVLSTGFAEAGPEPAQCCRPSWSRWCATMACGCWDRTAWALSACWTSWWARSPSRWSKGMPPAGQVGIVSQSGNIGSFTMRNMAERGLGVSRFIATGNEADVDVADGIAALAHDPATRIILCCMETCRDAGRLIEALDMARQQRKPVIASQDRFHGAAARPLRPRTPAR